MKKLLYIKANPKTNKESRTFKISESFIQAYKDTNPNDEIITLDLYNESMRFLTIADLGVIHGASSEENKNNLLIQHANQFALADKYVFAGPMWNLSIPSILKAYFDFVTVSGITFHYTAQGPLGLLENKKALHITSRGGIYSTEPASQYEMGDRYLRTIIGFMGVTDYTCIAAEGLDLMEQDVDTIIQESIEQAKILAKTF